MELITVKIEDVKVERRIRKDVGDLTPLMRSIGDVGLISPIVINLSNVLISGGRRLEACSKLCMGEIPALRIDVDADSMQALDIQSGENLCRKALTNEELAHEIEMKKSAMSPPEQEQGMINSIKNLFNKS